MLDSLKKSVRYLAPNVYYHVRQRYKPDARLLRRLVRRQGLSVSSGPFRGMRYIDQSRGSSLTPKLLGSYESELHDVIQQIITMRPGVVVDIGCAEGYYAIGFARVLPMSTIYAYDIDEVARTLARQLAEINDVTDRVILRSHCTGSNLTEIPLSGSVVLCDCEGYEAELFTSSVIDTLHSTTLLVETHEFLLPGITNRLSSLFRQSHDVTIIAPCPRRSDDYPATTSLPKGLRDLALYERELYPTPSTFWMYMRPRVVN
jgi:hypothetical protein